MQQEFSLSSLSPLPSLLVTAPVIITAVTARGGAKGGARGGAKGGAGEGIKEGLWEGLKEELGEERS